MWSNLDRSNCVTDPLPQSRLWRLNHPCLTVQDERASSPSALTGAPCARTNHPALRPRRQRPSRASHRGLRRCSPRGSGGHCQRCRGRRVAGALPRSRPAPGRRSQSRFSTPKRGSSLLTTAIGTCARLTSRRTGSAWMTRGRPARTPQSIPGSSGSGSSASSSLDLDGRIVGQRDAERRRAESLNGDKRPDKRRLRVGDEPAERPAGGVGIGIAGPMRSSSFAPRRRVKACAYATVSNRIGRC